MKENNHILDQHVKSYIQDVFESSLLAEGFVCPDDQLICWYRVKNHEVVNSIVFFSSGSKMPVYLKIGYGIHPLFTDPTYTKHVSFGKRPLEDDKFVEINISENCPVNETRYMCYSDQISVMVPGRDGKGLYTFSGILLPWMNKIQSIDDALEFHKDRRRNHPLAYLEQQDHKLGSLSRTFIDMAISVGDVEVYPYCVESTVSAIRKFENLCSKHPSNRQFMRELMYWKQIQHALVDHERNEYLSILMQRKNDNIQLLQQKFGITF